MADADTVDVDPRTWPDDRPDGAVARTADDPEVATLHSRVEELEKEVLRLEDALHRADIRQKTLIDQAAKDVVEAARTGKMPSKNRRPKTNTPRDMQRVKAEDELWDATCRPTRRRHSAVMGRAPLA